MINVADIVISDLPSIVMGDWSGLPDAAGVYFARNVNGDVLYIGKAKSLKDRWSSTHHRYKQIKALGGERLHWLIVENIERIDLIETACIAHFKPRLNRLMPKLSSDPTTPMTFTISTAHRQLLCEMQQIAADKYGVSYSYSKLIEASISALYGIIIETD